MKTSEPTKSRITIEGDKGRVHVFVWSKLKPEDLVGPIRSALEQYHDSLSRNPALLNYKIHQISIIPAEEEA